MTFLPTLKRLMDAFNAETDALKRFAYGQQIDVLLRNNAAEIAALVEDMQDIAKGSLQCADFEKYAVAKAKNALRKLNAPGAQKEMG